MDNLATLDQTAEGVPVLTQLTDSAHVIAVDWTLNYQWTELFNLGISTELYDYNAVFKRSFAIAPTQMRATLSGLWDNQQWRISTAATWVDRRDLSDYGYTGFDKNNGSGNKPTMAPAYFNVDTKIAYKISDNIELYFGALNLLDYNQAENESSPLLFDEFGGYNVTYIFAPMRGRTAYVGFDLDFG